MIKLFKKNINKGISLMELLVVFSIISILVAFTVPNLSNFRKQQAMVNTTEDIISLLNEARNNTISSKNSTVYGVHFESSRAVMFSGSVFVDSASNKQIDFDNSVMIPSTGGISINGGGSDVVFNRLTGNTTKYGIITLQLVSDATKQKIINISPVGVMSVN